VWHDPAAGSVRAPEFGFTIMAPPQGEPAEVDWPHDDANRQMPGGRPRGVALASPHDKCIADVLGSSNAGSGLALASGVSRRQHALADASKTERAVRAALGAGTAIAGVMPSLTQDYSPCASPACPVWFCLLRKALHHRPYPATRSWPSAIMRSPWVKEESVYGSFMANRCTQARKTAFMSNSFR
jgi:hypothetical protein